MIERYRILGLLGRKGEASYMKEFEIGIDNIQKKYIDFFRNRPSLIGDVHDSLTSHFTFDNNEGLPMLLFKENSGLPDDIRHEVAILYNNVFVEN